METIRTFFRKANDDGFTGNCFKRENSFPKLRPIISGIYLISLFLFSCRTPFDPDVPGQGDSILVVEGYLDADGKKSELKLSRMTAIESATAFSPELNAIVYLEASSGAKYYLEEEGEGTYVFEHVLAIDLIYELVIELQNGERYQSDEIVPMETPEILEAGFIKDETGVEIFVNAQGNEKVDDFLWTFQEDWIFRSYTQAGFIYDQVTRTVKLRSEEEDIYTCYKTEPNPGILLETSSKFQEQVVFRKTITEIPDGNERLQARYSILITQMGLPSEAVKFWESLKKNTEEIGSIFSPLPSVISGNIHSLDDNRAVVGQVNIGKVHQRRIYINRQDVSPWNYNNPLFFGCVVEDTPLMIGTFDFHLGFGSGDYLPARAFPPEGLGPTGYHPVLARCGDCTLYGSKTKPLFWED